MVSAIDQERVTASDDVKEIWRAEVFPHPQWERGAIDAYLCRRPQLTSEEYLAGYCEQLKHLPVDKGGSIEWFRYRSDGGWKLTDNL